MQFILHLYKLKRVRTDSMFRLRFNPFLFLLLRFRDRHSGGNVKAYKTLRIPASRSFLVEKPEIIP